MPRREGREVLLEIKKVKELQAIPVVVLSTSNADEDIMISYAMGASCYFVKPVVKTVLPIIFDFENERNLRSAKSQGKEFDIISTVFDPKDKYLICFHGCFLPNIDGRAKPLHRFVSFRTSG